VQTPVRPASPWRRAFLVALAVWLVLEVFPAFLMLARIGARPLVDRADMILAVGAQAVLLYHFLHGGWVG
jgi:hypothetical protein